MNSQSLLQEKSKLTPELFSHSLKNRGKIFWCEEEQFWIVTDYRLAEKLLKSPDLSANRSPYFASRMHHIDPSSVSNFFGVVQHMMVNSDTPKHSYRRRLAHGGISDHALEEFKPSVEKTVAHLLEKLNHRIETDRIEFVSDIAQELPSIVLADLFGVDPHDRQNFYECANHMTQFFGAGSGCPMSHAHRADQSASHLREYFKGIISLRRKNPGHDFISRLLKLQHELDLGDDEVISQAIMMLVAGKVTTTDQICNNLFLLLDVWDQLHSNPNLLSSAIEEATRLDPAVNFVFRVVKQEIRIPGGELRPGDVVFISIHGVNRDSEVFDQPDLFRMDRAKNPHFSYGHGSHYCLGAKLARIQMNTLFGALLQQFPRLRIDPEYPPRRKHQSIAFSGFESLHLRTL